MSRPARVAVIGGAGRIALLLASRTSTTHEILALHRSEIQKERVEASGARSVLFDVVHSTVPEFAQVLRGADVIVYAAGSGDDDDDEERSKAIDYQGAVKTFDAIESMPEPRPRLILISSIDVRLDQNTYPPHYNDKDKERSIKAWKELGTYLKHKYLADVYLVKRTSFDWTIIRPGGLIDEPATGRVAVGRTHIKDVRREDIAEVLTKLLLLPEANGLVLDIVSGDVLIPEALQAAIGKRESSWIE